MYDIIFSHLSKHTDFSSGVVNLSNALEARRIASVRESYLRQVASFV